MTPSHARSTGSVCREISVIVVTHGAREMSLRSLDSLSAEMARHEGEVIIVDNASDCGLASEISARYPGFRVLAQACNCGFAGAANLAADVAQGRRLLFLNPDTVVPESAIRRLLEFAGAKPGAGIWGGRTLYENGKTNPHSTRRRLSIWNLFCSAVALDTRYPDSPLLASMGYGGWNRDSERGVDVVCGCFLLVDRLLWDRLGGFSPAFFMYGEDDDLCLRANRLGFQPQFTPNATIIHHGSGTEARQDRKISQILAARALLIRGYFPRLLRSPATLLLTVRPLLGRRLAKLPLRPVWSNVWAQRRQWKAGRFVA